MDAEVRQPAPRGQRRFYDRELAGVYRTTVDGAFVDCNEAMARILGYASRDELLGDDAPLPFDDRPAALGRLRRTGTVAGEEGCLRRRDGRPVAVVYSEQLRREADGRELVEGTLIDVTGRRAHTSGDRLLAALAGGVAHRVTEPLSAVVANLGFALETLDLLGARGARQDGDLTGELGRALRDAKQSAEALRVVVRDLSVFAQGGEGGRGTTDLARLVESALATVMAELCERATIEISFPEGLRAVGDEAALGRCLLQVLLEAGDAMADGARDHVLRVSAFQDGDWAVVEVSDTRRGPVRAEPLGLLRCHLLLAAMGGTLQLLPGAGAGRVARLQVPVAF